MKEKVVNRRYTWDAGGALAIRRERTMASSEYQANRVEVVRRVLARVRPIAGNIEAMKAEGGFTKMIERAVREVTAHETPASFGLFGIGYPIREALLHEIGAIRVDVTTALQGRS